MRYFDKYFVMTFFAKKGWMYSTEGLLLSFPMVTKSNQNDILARPIVILADDTAATAQL